MNGNVNMLVNPRNGERAETIQCKANNNIQSIHNHNMYNNTFKMRNLETSSILEVGRKICQFS